jgi:GAF domain-containing protein
LKCRLPGEIRRIARKVERLFWLQLRLTLEKSMNLTTAWSIAATTYIWAGAGAAGLCWAIWRWAPRQRETFLLLSSLALLVLQYGAVAADAWSRTHPMRPLSFTVWGGAAQTLLALFWTLLIAFLLAVVRRLQAPEVPERSFVISAIVGGSVLSAVAIVLFGFVTRDLLRGETQEVINNQLARLMRGISEVPSIIFAIVPGMLLNMLFHRLPKKDRTGWLRWAGQQRQPEVIALNLTARPSAEVADPIPAGDFKALSGIYATGVLLITTFLFMRDDPSAWSVPNVFFSIIVRLLLLLSVMSLVYYQTRFSFFDVILKRGLLYVSTSAIVITVCYSSSMFALPSQAAPERATFSLVGALFVCVIASLFARGEQFLDRWIFDRPDYRKELQLISEEMARCPNAEALRDTVTKALKRTLGTDFVEYQDEPTVRSGCSVRIGTPEHNRGYLLLGQRHRGQPYRSEDLNFLDAVAAQYAGMLESFEARHSQHLVTMAELRALRAQINPHFLFNALNTLADMAHGHPALERAILNLSKVFRYALDSTRREFVPLREEIASIRSYLEIEKERFEERLCQEDAKALCCTKDEGGPFGVAL